MEKGKIGVLIGSLGSKSHTRKISEAFIKLAPQSLEFVELAIGDLPLYNQDLEIEGNAPPAWTAFREKAKGMDGFLFFTPEYNRATTAALKNALDVGSRPWGASIWNGKPGAVVSVSPGALGAFGANHNVRAALVCVNVPTMQQPEAYIGNAANLLNEDGSVKDAGTRDFFELFMSSFKKWVDNNSQNK